MDYLLERGETEIISKIETDKLDILEKEKCYDIRQKIKLFGKYLIKQLSRLFNIVSLEIIVLCNNLPKLRPQILTTNKIISLGHSSLNLIFSKNFRLRKSISHTLLILMIKRGSKICVNVLGNQNRVLLIMNLLYK